MSDDGLAFGWCPLCRQALRLDFISEPGHESMRVACPDQDDDEHREFFAWLWEQAKNRIPK